MGTPVLYLRAPDGRISDANIPPPVVSTFPAPTPEMTETPPSPVHQDLLDPPAPSPAEPGAFRNPPTVLTLRHRYRFGTGFGVELLCHGLVYAVVFSPDGRWLATASDDHTARVWDTSSGQELAKVTHEAPVYGVVFSPGGHRLATAS